MVKLNVKTYERSNDTWKLVLTHTFHGKNRKQALGFHKAHRKSDAFYDAGLSRKGAEPNVYFGTYGKIKLKTVMEWASTSDAGSNLERAEANLERARANLQEFYQERGE